MKQYISKNRSAYDRLASEYKARLRNDSKRERKIIAPFIDYLNKAFLSPIRVLDVGCGAGINLEMFAEEGFFTTGIDISRNMLSMSQEVCPKANLIKANFLNIKFQPNNFEGIFLKASIHLMPSQDAEKALRKVYKCLVPNGMLFVATTVEPISKEGFYKKNQNGVEVMRFRKFWRPDELVQKILDSGFSMKKIKYNLQPDTKTKWISCFAIKPLVSSVQNAI